MSRADLQALRADVKQEWEAILRSLHDLDLLPRVAPDSLQVRAAGSILHDFYTGLESVFSRIALAVDGSLPQGSDWHSVLLRRMAAEVPAARPPVISNDLAETLEDYLRFRHVFRHNYGFKLRWTLMAPLLATLPDVVARVEADLKGFDVFLAEA